MAVAEEYPNDAAERVQSGGLMHDRRVARIITPGTLIDENFMDPYANNYVMAVRFTEPAQDPEAPNLSEPSKPGLVTLGLAWLDLSTGRFFTQSADIVRLPSIISRVCPREVVLDKSLQDSPDHDIFNILAEDRHLITYATSGDLEDIEQWDPLLESEIEDDMMDTFTTDEVSAGCLVLNYVKDRLQGLSMKLQAPIRQENMDIMTIDKNSMRALEIRQTIRDGFFKGSLLHALRRTATKSGARLLNEWLSSPSTSLDVIRLRQDIVARFIEAEPLRESIVYLLSRSHDSQRLVQKFALGRGDADDLLGLSSTIRASQEIAALLRYACTSSDDAESDCLTSLIDRLSLKDPGLLAQRIEDAIDEEGILGQHQVEDSEANHMLNLAQEVENAEGVQSDASVIPKGKKKRPTSIREYYSEENDLWMMRPSASPQLATLHQDLAQLLEERVQLGDNLREKLGTASLTLRWTPGLGHIAHIKGKDAKNLTEIRTLSSSRSTRSFHLPEWTALGQRLDQVRMRIRAEEQRVLISLREHVVVNLVKLRRNAAVLDELDIATSFATYATEHRLVRPQLNNSTSHTIVGGRHPTVEGGLFEQGRSFVHNDCFVGNQTDGRIWLITGPNMAGKSTFLRQNALITIMAQVGSYVPAEFAELGIVDAIYSRVGSADNLYRDQSTFMVEMLETAHILTNATPRSFVIMDEIGRGTTPEDGTAVSYACLHQLATVNQCRTLFATHFHEVADLAAADGLCDSQGKSGVVQAYCTDVTELDKGEFIYIHKLRRGINRQSHALKVATMAGLPEQVIEKARRVLARTGADDRRSTTSRGAGTG